MAKGKKKQTRNLIILCLCVILVVVTYILVINKGKSNNNDTTEVDTGVKSILVVEYPTEDIKNITVRNSHGTLSYIMEEDGTVKNQNDLDMPLNQGYGKNMFKGIAEMTATSSLGKVESLSDYGLDNPSIQVDIIGKERADITLLFGDEVPLDGGRYVMQQGGEEVYIVNNTYYSYYNYSEIDMVQVTTLPTISSEYITEITITKDNEELISLIYDESKPSDRSNANFWTVRAKGKPTLAGSVDEIQNYAANYGSFSFIKCVDYNGRDLAKYGLDNPTKVYVEYFKLEAVEGKEEQQKVYSSIELWIGNEVDGNYYVKEASSNAIHTMSKSSVLKLLEYNYFTLVNKFVSLVNIKDVEKILLSGYNEKHELEVIQGSKKEDSEDYNYTYKINGKELEDKTFKSIYQELIGIKYDRDLVDDEKGRSIGKNSIFTIEFLLRDGNSIKVKYHDFDDNYLKVVMNDLELFLVDKRVVKELLEELNTIE